MLGQSGPLSLSINASNSDSAQAVDLAAIDSLAIPERPSSSSGSAQAAELTAIDSIAIPQRPSRNISQLQALAGSVLARTTTGPPKKDTRITILLIPSEVRGDKRLLRLRVIARTWGNQARDFGIRLVAFCSEPEAALYRREMPELEKVVELIVVPAKYVSSSDLLQGIYLGWLDHGPTLDQEMWALQQVNGGQDDLPDWVIVVNDAAFFLPGNLICFFE